MLKGISRQKYLETQRKRQDLVAETCYGIVPVRTNNGVSEVLLCKGRNCGAYVIPKGHAEEGETEIESAVRELLEETGHAPYLFWTVSGWSESLEDASQIEPIEYLTFKRDTKIDKTIKFYIAQVREVGPILDTHEVERVDWFPIHSIPIEELKYPEISEYILSNIAHRLL